MRTKLRAGTKTRRRAHALTWLVAASLIAASCGSSSGSDGSSSDSGKKKDTSAAAAVLGAKNPAKGAPVLVGVISGSAASTPGAAAWKRAESGLNMMAAYANEYAGGIGGRPIELFICEGHDTPAGWQDCGNQMVNKGVVAVIEPLSGLPSVIPILTKAGVPYLTIAGSSAEELTTKGAFSMTGGFPATLAAWAAHAKEHGIKKFALVGIDSPAITAAAKALGGAVFKKAGVEFEFVPAAIGTPDMTPQLQAAISGGADALAVLGDITFCTSFMQAYQTLGLKAAKYLISLCVDKTTIPQYGESMMKGSSMIGAVTGQKADPDIALYKAAAETLGKGVPTDPADDPGAAAGAAALETFVRLVKGLTGDISPATVLKSITSTDAALFLGGGSKLTCNGSAIPVFTSICSGYMLIGVMDAQGRMTNDKLINAAPLYAP
jgi:branched-chain amino acid transport system substrate-binding protein